MLKNRLIPVVLLRNGNVVQSKAFNRYQRLGNPTVIVERLSDWASDELIYLDISPRDAKGEALVPLPGPESVIEVLRDVARVCFMPLAFGGGIRSIQDCAQRIEAGADKVVINTAAIDRPEFITECAEEFGSQCVVVCMDVRQQGESWHVFRDGGRVDTGTAVEDWARQMQERGAGELLVQSIDRDGSGTGYDIPLLESVSSVTQIPLIAMGGVGQWDHLLEGLRVDGVDAVAAGNIFNYTEQSVYKAKKFLHEAGANVRPPGLR